MNLSKREALFRKLDKRHEDHQAAKEQRCKENSEQDESKETLAKLLGWVSDLNCSIEFEMENCDKENAQEILDTVSVQMQNLDIFFTEKAPVLTPFDTKKVQLAVLDIRSKYGDLQDALRPKKKFGFRGDKKKAFQKNTNSNQSHSDIKNTTNIDFHGFCIKEKSNEIIEVDANDVLGQDVMLSQLSNCTITIKSNPVTLHATNLTNCILKCGPVQTSVYFEECNNCTFSLACQQMRAHNSRKTKIYLHVTSKGIIEDCHDIQVIICFDDKLFPQYISYLTRNILDSLSFLLTFSTENQQILFFPSSRTYDSLMSKKAPPKFTASLLRTARIFR